MSPDVLVLLVPGAGVLALVYALVSSSWINKQDPGTDRMREIGGYIREGAMAFLAREYKILAMFVVAVAGLLAFANAREGSSPIVAVSFVIGAICSGLAGFFGMRIATSANVRTTAAAREGLVGALAIAFRGGAVIEGLTLEDISALVRAEA